MTVEIDELCAGCPTQGWAVDSDSSWRRLVEAEHDAAHDGPQRFCDHSLCVGARALS